MARKIVIHNSISLDGSLLNFEVNMQLHYRIAGKYKPDLHLIGSNTIAQGIEMYGEGIPAEKKKDFEKPKRSRTVPYWVIIDTKGKLKGMLHICRRFEMCRDVILLLCERTPKSYIKHLEERNYDHHIVGKKHVDLKKAFRILSKKYGATRVLTDTGRQLGNLLLDQGFVDEISLLVHPVIVGRHSVPMFSDIHKKVKLELIRNRVLEKNYLWLVYRVARIK